MNSTPVSLELIQAAHERIRPFIHRTPVLTCGGVRCGGGRQLFFKCENFQKVGAFKARGAHNPHPWAERRRGGAWGGHADDSGPAAHEPRWRWPRGFVARALRRRAFQRAASKEGGGGRLWRTDHRMRAHRGGARGATTAEFMAGTSAVLIHPYDDDRVVAGQGRRRSNSSSRRRNSIIS